MHLPTNADIYMAHLTKEPWWGAQHQTSLSSYLMNVHACLFLLWKCWSFAAFTNNAELNDCIATHKKKASVFTT